MFQHDAPIPRAIPAHLSPSRSVGRSCDSSTKGLTAEVSQTQPKSSVLRHVQVRTLLTRANVFSYIPIAVVALLLIFGGASRNDALSQVFVGTIGVLALGWGIFQADRRTWQRGRLLLGLLGAFGVWHLLQLVPLPADIWRGLPGRQDLAADLAGIGLGELWRPISLTPDRTLSSLLGLIPLLAVVVLLAGSRRDLQLPLLTSLVAIIVLSGIIGAAQVASGSGYFYRITNEGAAVGLFANRNHQAALLACGLPITACWMVWPRRHSRAQRTALLFGICIIAGIFPLLLITGSRAGILLGGLATLAAAAIVRLGWSSARINPSDRRNLRPLLFAPFVIGGLLALTAMLTARDVALQRLLAADQDSVRRDLLPFFLEMAGRFFPFGAGFGSFDPVFRMLEPTSNLSPNYLNQAHNDVVQLGIEGGMPGLVIAITGIIAILVYGTRGLLGKLPDRAPFFSATALSVLVLLLLASAVDYPLRTPGLAVLFTLFTTSLLIGAWQEDSTGERVGSSAHID